jgi:signal transduction histidine kinase
MDLVPEDKERADVLGMADLLHVLTESVEALDKSARVVVANDGVSSEDDIRWRLLEEKRGRQSLFTDLEWKTRQREIPYEDLARLLKIILRETERFRFLLLNLNGFLARDTPIGVRRTRVRLSELVDEVVDLFEFSALEKGIDIEKNIQDDPVLWVDRDLLQRCLVNIFDNALKYSFSRSERGGRRFIDFSVRRHSTDGKWLMTIKSYGVGLLQEEIREGKIFEYGVRGSLARDRDRAGTGIGLPEAKRIVEAHGGKLQIESVQVVGNVYLTIVSIILPAR